MHNYLGVDLDFLIDGKVQLFIIHFLNDIISDFPECLGTKSASPDADHMLKLQYEEEAQPLTDKQAVEFHHVVVHMLFLSSRAIR